MKAELSIKLLSYFAPNCPRRIVALNGPHRIVRAELSFAELSGNQADMVCRNSYYHTFSLLDEDGYSDILTYSTNNYDIKVLSNYMYERVSEE